MSLLEKWTKALESGRYRQTQEVLHSYAYLDKDGEYQEGDAYCCLGVLEKVSRGKISRHSDDTELLEYQDFNKFFDLRRTKEVKEQNIRLDIPGDSDLEGDWTHVQDCLASLNDKGKSFKEISRWIKKNLKDKV